MILELKDSVTTVETSKRLKELGVRQDSQYYHYHGTCEFGADICSQTEILPNGAEENDDIMYCKLCSAYTDGELGVLFIRIGIAKMPYLEYYSHEQDICWKFDNPFTELQKEIIVLGKQTEFDEAEARGKNLIHLLENKIISVKEINGEKQ